MAQQPGKDIIQSKTVLDDHIGQPTVGVVGVVGMLGGTMEGGNVAGINHGKMRADRNKTMGNVGDGANANMGDHVSNMRANCSQGDSRNKARDGPFKGLGIEDITCTILVDILKKNKMADIAEKFDKEGIDGSIFSDLLESHFAEMNITGLNLLKITKTQSKLPKD